MTDRDTNFLCSTFLARRNIEYASASLMFWVGNLEDQQLSQRLFEISNKLEDLRSEIKVIDIEVTKNSMKGESNDNS